ncbi:MAG: NADH-quinone oxidoreductase subunit N [Verrucomicrobiota bacterium]|nr:NADH-quinone oxidoreductase subunit N [Verrucomicrobiota bacterium]
MNYLELLRLAFPEAHVVVTALVVLAIGLTRPRAKTLTTAVAAVGLVLAAIAVVRLPEQAAFSGAMLVISPLSSLFKLICLTLALFTVLLAHSGSDSRRHHAEYLALLLLGTVGLLLLVGSDELLMIFIGLELTGLSLYLMTAFDKTDPQSAEAGLKYFLFGSTASAFTLFGLSFVYGMAGSTTLATIGEKLSGGSVQPLLAAGIVMTLVGFAFKIAAAPFHLWAADAYQGAPIPSAAFIASGSKVASFVVLGKLVLVGFGPLQGSAAWHAMTAGWSPILAALAAVSIVVGNLVALAQRNVRRLLAYSAVAHAGYTLLGLVSGPAGFPATLFYTTIYAFTLVGAFAVIAQVRAATGGDDIANFTGLRSRSPLLASCMAIFLLSLAGLPPLAGFFGKFYLFSAALAAGDHHGLLWLVALALLGSLVSLYYYLTILRAIFVEDHATAFPPITSSAVQRVPLTVLASGVIVAGILPTNLVDRILAALQ